MVQSGRQLGLTEQGNADFARLQGLDPIQNGKAGMDHCSERQYENPEEGTCYHEKRFNEYCFHIFVSLPPGAQIGKRTRQLFSRHYDFLSQVDLLFFYGYQKQFARRGQCLFANLWDRFSLRARWRAIC